MLWSIVAALGRLTFAHRREVPHFPTNGRSYASDQQMGPRCTSILVVHFIQWLPIERSVDEAFPWISMSRH